MRPAIGLSPEIPLPVKRDLIKLSQIASQANTTAETAKATAISKLGKSSSDLLYIAQQVRAQLQIGGQTPLITGGLLGVLSQPQIAGVPNLTALPAGGPYTQPGALVSVNGVLYGFQNSPNTPLIPYTQPILEDTHANRLANFPATHYPKGVVFYETDRTSVYITTLVSGVMVWKYVTGLYPVAQASLPTDLGLNDGGFLVLVTDYQHSLLWNTIGWQFGPGDPGSQYMVGTITNPPKGGIWQLCDGSSVNCLNPDGTLSMIAVPNLISQETAIHGGGYAGVNTATSPTWQGGAKTDDTQTQVPIGGVSISYAAGPNGATYATPGTYNTTPAPHHHDLSNANAVLNPPSVANGGLSQWAGMMFYFRR